MHLIEQDFFRTWNVTIDTTGFLEKVVNLDTTASASAGTWDPTLIDEIAFYIFSGK